MSQVRTCPTTSGTSTLTVTSVNPEENNDETTSGRASPNLVLKLKKPKPERRVGWSSDVVDNEHMNKKKSKCCCVYTKPKLFGESSSESEDDCEHCTGHVEVKKKNQQPQHSHQD